MKLYSTVPTENLPHTNHLFTLNTESFCVEVDPIDRKTYHATAETAALGALTVSRIESQAAVVTRKNESDEEPAFRRFSIVFAIKGDVVISHHLGMTSLKEGQFTLLDNSFTRTMFVYAQVSLLLISIPRQVLHRYIPVPEDVEAQILLDQKNADGSALFAPVLSLWDHMKRGSLREFAPTIAEDLLGDIAGAYSQHCRQQSSRAVKRISEAKQFIESQLGNPELSVEGIASGLGVSSRYLRGLFHGSEKLSHYILRRRLEESANQLSNALHQNCSITSIAFRCGFNSTAHFSRAFKSLYAMTPRDYRRKNLPQEAAGTRKG